MNLEKIIDVAKGAIKADLVIKNANVINVFTEEIYEADVAVADGKVVGIGQGYCGEKEIDIKGAYLSHSFIDGHVNLESSMLLQ